MVVCETEYDIHFIESLHFGHVTQWSEGFFENGLYALGMDSVTGQPIDIDTLPPFYLADECTIRISPSSIVSGGGLHEFREAVVYGERIENLFFRHERRLRETCIKIIEMRRRIRFAREARDLLFVLEGIFEIDSIAKGISSENHLGRYISPSISRFRTQGFARDRSSHGFEIESSPRQVADTLENMFHLGVVEKQIPTLQVSFFRGIERVERSFVQSSGAALFGLFRDSPQQVRVSSEFPVFRIDVSVEHD